MAETLSFDPRDHYFYLSGETVLRRAPLVLWERVSSISYRTKSLREAARFKPEADETAERVFTRVFNSYLEVPPLPSTLGFLDAHQLEGVNWILSRKRSYLAHAPGAGKTAQAIVASCLIRSKGQTVFIVPPELIVNWGREIDRFTTYFRGFYTVGIVGTSLNKKAVAWGADYLIVPDSMLAKDWVQDRLTKMSIKLLAVDEASRFKEPSSLRTVALFGGYNRKRRFAGIAQKAGRVVLLDGSPMPNRPIELWAPTYALDPEAIDCMTQLEYGLRYCGAQRNFWGAWEFKYSTNEAELRERLRRRFMHVVTEEELEHPERRRSLLFMNQDTRTPEMRDWEKKNLLLLRTKEISESLSQGELAEHRKRLGLSKIAWVSKYISGRIRDGKKEKILVFGWHREVCTGIHEALLRAGVRSALVIGGTPADERERAFERFQSGDLVVIVGNISAMGRGHNLQRADRVVFAESSWSDELNRQCEKRAARRGRAKESAVRCEYVVVPDSLDEKVLQAIFAKASRVREVIG
jgi:SWI/SNF-related matrix-associated actin-dependent regulator 1 of chromatin subfamily A